MSEEIELDEPVDASAAVDSDRKSDVEDDPPSDSHSNTGYEADNTSNGDLHPTPAAAVVDDVEKAEEDNDEIDPEEKMRRRREREKLFFRDGFRRIDYVLTYEDSDDSNVLGCRETFEHNIDMDGLDLELEDKSNSVDGKTYFLKLHATWDAIAEGAKLLNMRKRIRIPKQAEEEVNKTRGCTCKSPFDPSDIVVPEEEDYFTAPFNPDRLHLFEVGDDEDDRQRFFTNAERSQIVRVILDKSFYDGGKFGIGRLLRNGCYTAAYPLHEGPYKPLTDDPEPWEGADKDRARLYESWVRPRRFLTRQPLDLVRKYYGEKVAIYFSWLGYYTVMLIPASLIGIAVFIYGLSTLQDDIPSNDICDKDGVGSIVMCPPCDRRCDYIRLSNSCIYAKVTYVFDNNGTVAFAIFMALWAAGFLEYWKRRQNKLQYDWDVGEYELEERIRPEYEYKVKGTKLNPITGLEEPHLSLFSRLWRACTSFSVILFMAVLVVAAIFGVIIYRLVVIVIFYSLADINQYSSILTSITAAVINLIVILLLNLVYDWLAKNLTDLELHRTESDYEDSLTIKMFLFKFVNFYGSTFYIAFFKGSFVGRPGSSEDYLFGKYRQDECDPSGCMVDLFLHLGIVLGGKQTINNIKELALPLVKNMLKKRSAKKNETEANLYMRWEQDKDLLPFHPLALFQEYLEMVIQFGFITIFVASFPLAPIFAFFNNLIEIRLDAYKLVCLTQRPPLQKSQNIGVWMSILTTIAHIAIASNAFIIAWTSDFIPKMVYIFAYSADEDLHGYVNNSLSYYNAASFSDDFKPDESEFNNVTICRYRSYREPPGSENEYDYTAEHWNVFCARLAFVIVFEHLCLILMSLVSFIIPDQPASVHRLRIYEKQLVNKISFEESFSNVRNRRTPHAKEIFTKVANVQRAVATSKSSGY